MDSLVRDVLAGGVSTSIVSGLLNPLDVIKTRLQLHTGELGTAGRAIAAVRALAAERGVIGLWTYGGKEGHGSNRRVF